MMEIKFRHLMLVLFNSWTISLFTAVMIVESSNLVYFCLLPFSDFWVSVELLLLLLLVPMVLDLRSIGANKCLKNLFSFHGKRINLLLPILRNTCMLDFFGCRINWFDNCRKVNHWFKIVLLILNRWSPIFLDCILYLILLLLYGIHIMLINITTNSSVISTSKFNFRILKLFCKLLSIISHLFRGFYSDASILIDPLNLKLASSNAIIISILFLNIF